jgi:hypothetical protein
VKRPSILLAIFIVALLGFITLNSVSHNSAGSRGLPAGTKPPPFAMPLSTSGCRGPCDANIAITSGQGTAGHRPACEVRGPQILNSCELSERGPFVLAFLFEPIAACREQVAGLERVAARFPQVRFAIVAVRADAAKARSLGAKLPVGYDHDGAVANEYSVVVCPTITYVARGGRVVGSSVGPQNDAALTSWVRKIA